MWGVRNAGAAALAIVSALCMSACTALEGLEPPPLETAFHPLPPPAPVSARAEIATWLSANGYRDFQVAALMQLADTESGFRPCVIGPGGYHYLYQWGGTRLRQLREYAQTSGCPQLKTQLAFADRELRSESSFSCFWGATSTPAAYVALRRIFGHGSC